MLARTTNLTRTLRIAAPALARMPARSAAPSLLQRGSLARALSSDASGSSSSTEEKPSEEAAAAEPAAEQPAAEGAEAAAEAADGEAAAEPSETETLQARVEELEEQVKDKHDQVLRALAEAENARRRASIDVENAHKFAVGKFAKSLLDVADNLSRAAESVPEEMRASEEQPVLRGLYDGVVMTETVLVKAFEANGMKKIWPDGEKFDPNLHNALFEMPDPSKEPGTVAHVANAGWSLHDRCIRAAGVGIVSKPA